MAKNIPVDEGTKKLNMVLRPFWLKVKEEWDGDKFAKWHIHKRFSFRQEIASLMPDCRTIALNPDGPRLDSKVVLLIEKEFGIKIHLIVQETSQGGR